MPKLSEIFRNNVLTHLGDRSQRWLASEAKINQGSLSQILSGQGNPTLETVEAISHALKVHPAQLLGGKTRHDLKEQSAIPSDILDLLDGKTDSVYDTIRMMLKTLENKSSKSS